MSTRRFLALGLALAFAIAMPPRLAKAQEGRRAPASPPVVTVNHPDPPAPSLGVNAALGATPTETAAPAGSPRSLVTTAQTVALFALMSLVPAAILMVSAFVRISIVLSLLRQAIGSPQVPGNQVLMALSLLLTAIVMWPVGERVYTQAVEPLAEGRISAAGAWKSGTGPIKAFMIEQICRTHHQRYLTALYAHLPESASQPEPTVCEQFPLRVIAPAFLLSELTTALFMGFAIYLPFLVIDLVVAAVLSAMGLFLLPPSLVALPLKLVLFVLADGWLLVADMLLRSFGGP